MKQRASFFGKLFNKEIHKSIEVKVDIIEYQEDNIFYVYSPALDLIGYGNNQQEARQSWEIVLEEYFQYAINKKTLIKDLQNHGWKVANNNKQFSPPSFTWMLLNNDQLSDVYNNHNFNKTSQPVKVPLHKVYA